MRGDRASCWPRYFSSKDAFAASERGSFGHSQSVPGACPCGAPNGFQTARTRGQTASYLALYSSRFSELWAQSGREKHQTRNENRLSAQRNVLPCRSRPLPLPRLGHRVPGPHLQQQLGRLYPTALGRELRRSLKSFGSSVAVMRLVKKGGQIRQ